MPTSMPLTLAEMLYEELEQLGPDSAKDLKDRIDVLRAEPDWLKRKRLSRNLVPAIYAHIHKQAQDDPGKRRSALCLSGGGIRSATFNLGVLQGLARAGLLEKFDYLATVSGGGFIGGWLTAWIHRTVEGVKGVAARLAQRADDPLAPEPDPLYNLRIYSNYLTPRKGLLSIDTWTLVAVYLRNLLLNWLVFLPVIVAFLMLPRIWVALIRSSHLSATCCLIVGLVSGAIALAYVGLNLPAARVLNRTPGWFVVFCLGPLILSAMALTSYWVRLAAPLPTRRQFVLFALVLAAIPWAFFLILKSLARLSKGRKTSAPQKQGTSWSRSLRNYVVATLLSFAALALTGIVTWFVVTWELPSPPTFQLGFVRLYATFAVPALLLLMTLGGTLIAGFTSRFTQVEDQEWWARSGAWILFVVVGWIAFHLLVLFGPTLFIELQTELVNKKNWNLKALTDVKATITTVIGLLAGAVALVGGFSSKTAANGDKGVKGTLGMADAGFVFAAFIVVVLALVSNWLLASSFGNWTSQLLHGPALVLKANDPRTIIYNSPGRVLVVLAAVVALVGVILGRVINTNRFSLHYYYRNRVMRAYLGASRKRNQTKDNFTGFDQNDNIQMHQLKQKPLHVINVTLNLVGGDKLEWQDRKAESFTVSPLHAGSYWLGYRKAEHYGGDDGISLANAVAISGAAASPNMGYMMTSPVVRFLMTLFNVRLGFWLGNPGLAGSGDLTTLNKPTFDRDCPTQSVRPILFEALGMTNSKSPYVYLSDGGHFENFGLYEMVLRRCRFIVVGDGSTDPGYSLDCLAQSIRQIRVDFGVPIEMGEINVGNDPAKKNKYCAIGTIRYSCVDNTTDDESKNADYDGVLIYLKPSLNGSEPRDVLNYRNSYPAFPEDSIADQWFSEAQFESYRMLGSHMIEQICKTSASSVTDPFDKFARQVRIQSE